MSRIFRSWMSVPGIALALTGCSGAGYAPLMPVHKYVGVDCVTQPDLSGAISLRPDQDKAVWTIEQMIDGSLPCLELDGSRAPYVIFEIPEEGWPAPIEIGGLISRARVLSPHVELLDENGERIRGFVPQDYHVRSSIYSVLFQPQPGERYALLTVNPVRIGSAYEGLRTGTTTTTIWTSYFATNWTSGYETGITANYSYEGLAVVNVYRPDDSDAQ